MINQKNEPRKTLTIGAVARQCGVRPHTLRFYERRGLISKPQRRPSGYREYTPETICLVRFIKGIQAMGFTLREVRALLGALNAKQALPPILGNMATAKIASLRQRVDQLSEALSSLLELVDWCQGGKRPTRGAVAEFIEQLDKGAKV